MHGKSESHTTKKLNLASPLADIMQHLAHLYYYRKFPKRTESNGGLLDYNAIRQKTVDHNKLYRKLHGLQNAIRSAMSIPEHFALYRKYQYYLPANIRAEIVYADRIWIKKIQILSAARAIGRTSDTGKGSKFCVQAQKECCQFLQQLGINASETEHLSQLLIDAEGINKTKSLGASLLAEVATIESFRDYSVEKNIPLAAFPFCIHLDKTLKIQDAMDEFIAICSNHANVIKSQQGYIFHALLGNQGKRVKGWPELDPRYISAEAEKIQIKTEYDEKLFEKCEQAFNSDRLKKMEPLKKPSIERQEIAFFKSFKIEANPLKTFSYPDPNLLTDAHLKGLKIIMDEDLEEFPEINITVGTQLIDTSGKLKGIAFYSRKNNLQRLATQFSLVILDSISAYDLHYMEFTPESIRKVAYAELDKKFGGFLPMELEDSHLETLGTLNKKIQDLLKEYANDYQFEKRYSGFNTQTSLGSGYLKNIILKIPRAPASTAKALRTGKDLLDFIPALERQLGIDSLKPFLKNYGDALDGNLYIAFRVEELKKGFNIEHVLVNEKPTSALI